MTRLDALANWCRKNSLWPMPFATACCGIELMATGASRHDLARFGAEAMRFSPRQSDLMIVAGRVVMKMLPVLQRIWQQMSEPKWCISMGACASTGGVFDTYAVVQGIDRFLPVDMYVPGCPPRPEQLLQAIIDLQDKIEREGTIAGKEFEHRQPVRALRELPILGQTPEMRSQAVDLVRAVSGWVAGCGDHERQGSERGRCYEKVTDALQQRFAGVTLSVFRQDTRVRVPRACLYEALQFLQQECGFDMLVDITCVDYLHYRDGGGSLWPGLPAVQHRRITCV